MNIISNTDAMITDKLIRMELFRLRKQKRLTQKQVSEMSGLSVACISSIESNINASPTLRSLIKYADALGADIYINSEK